MKDNVLHIARMVATTLAVLLAAAPMPAAPAVNQASQATNNVTINSGEFSTTPVNLALCAELNGKVVYITQQQWKAMPPVEQFACKKKGLCVIGNNERFLLALNDSGEKGMTWDEAMSRYGNSLPTKEQAEVMGKNYKAINAAIKAFGGDKDPAWVYWTRTENDSSYAWIVSMSYGCIGTGNKPGTNRVRAVTPVPSSAK